MKNWRFWALMILSVFALGGVAGADSHYEALAAYQGKVYALKNEETGSYPSFVYFPSEIVEFNEDLTVSRSMVLDDGTSAAKNSGFLARYGGKLYIGSTGSGLPNTEWGAVWEVDIASWTARQILNVSDTGVDPFAGISGLAIANDGTAFLLVGGYDDSFNFSATLFITTVAALANGNTGSGMPISSEGGYSWGIAWSEFDQTLWMMAGSELQARSKSGGITEAFNTSQLGNNINTISPLEGRAGLFYTAVPDDYSSTSAGFITKTGSTYAVQKDLVTNLGGDTAVFAFMDHNGNARLLLREYQYGPNDLISVYDPENFSSPLVNASDWGTNIHSIATLGKYLYLGTYEGYNPGEPDQLSGEIKRVDLSVYDVPDKPDKPEEPDKPSNSSGGGGCDSGFGVMAWLLLASASLIKRRKR